jgi:transposase-like protein
MQNPKPFKWRHYQAEIILLCVRWYLRYALSYRDLEEMMAERGLTVDHSTIARWVLAYAPELDKRVKPQLKPTGDSWRVDETYIKVKGVWVYQYRAVDSDGNTLDFRLSAKRDAEAAQAFFEKTLGAPHTVAPRVINVDKNAAYPKAVETLKALHHLAPDCALRQVKYLNNLIEQDHRFIKRRTRPGLGFFAFETAQRTLSGYETMNMIRKGQAKGADKGDILAQVRFIESLFGVAA